MLAERYELEGRFRGLIDNIYDCLMKLQTLYLAEKPHSLYSP